MASGARVTRDHQLIEKVGGVTVASRGTVSTWAERMSSVGLNLSLFSAECETSPAAAAITATDTKETVLAHCMASSDIAPTIIC